MITSREKFPLPEAQRRVEPVLWFVLVQSNKLLSTSVLSGSRPVAVSTLLASVSGFSLSLITAPPRWPSG